MAEKFAVQAVFTAVDHFSGPVSRMSDSMSKLNRGTMGRGGTGSSGAGGHLARTAAQASAAWGRLDQRFASAKTNMLIAGVAGGYAAKRLITAGADVESALLSGSAKFGDGIRRNTPAFRELENAAFDLGRTTKFGAVEAAGALNELAASGFDPSAAMKSLPIIAQMAVAGGEELAYASQIALDSLGNFGMLNNELGQLRGPEELATNLTRVADIMAYTANQTTASMDSMFETLKDAGAIGKLGGMTFEKFAAITGALAQAGIKGTVAGTAIKNITVRLLSPTSEGSKELRRLKIDEKQFRKMSDPLDQFEVIAKAIGNLPKEDQIKAMDEYFGKIPLAAAANFVQGGFMGARNLEQRILANAAGSNARQADIMDDGTDTKMALLKNKFEDIGKVIFNQIQTPLESTIQNTIDWLNNNKPQIAQKANETVDWFQKNGSDVGDALKFGAYTFGAVQGAKLLVGGAKLTKDLYTMGAGAVAAAGSVGAATAKFMGRFGTRASSTALLMGQVAPKAGMMARLGLSGSAGLATGGLSLLAEGAYQTGSYFNEDTKSMTQGLGTWDLISGAFRNSDGRGMMGVVDDHQNALARQEAQRRLIRGFSDAPDTGFDAALANSQYGDLSIANPNEAIVTALGELSQHMQVEPLIIPPESITVKPVDLQSVFDAIAAQIAASGPQVVGTEDKNAGANQDFSDAYSRTDLNVSVEAMPGTKARTTQSTHTKPNNHRNGTN